MPAGEKDAKLLAALGIASVDSANYADLKHTIKKYIQFAITEHTDRLPLWPLLPLKMSSLIRFGWWAQWNHVKGGMKSVKNYIGDMCTFAQSRYGYECKERFCSPNDMGGWSTIIGAGSPVTCFQQTTAANCDAAGCDWIDNLPAPTMYPKCLMPYSSCALNVGADPDNTTGTTCCYGQQCMCKCRWMDGDGYNCPCYNQRQLYGIVEEGEGVALPEINGCGFTVLRTNDDGTIDYNWYSAASMLFADVKQLFVGVFANHQEANSDLRLPESDSLLNNIVSGGNELGYAVNWGPSS
jgi:hypothetical protein